MYIALCDDNLETMSQYSAQLESLSRKFDIPVTLKSYSSGEAFLFSAEDKTSCPELVYLDINMPGTNGIRVAERLREMHLPVEIIFLTVSKEHWPDAFDVEAVNYIVKDCVTPERFEKAFLQAVRRVQDRREDTILLNCVGQTRNIRVRDITYFEVQRNLMIVHYIVDGRKRKFEFYSTMARVEELLWNKGFIRIHRSFLAALNRIECVTSKTVQMQDGTELPVGPSYVAAVIKGLEAQKT